MSGEIARSVALIDAFKHTLLSIGAAAVDSGLAADVTADKLGALRIGASLPQGQATDKLWGDGSVREDALVAGPVNAVYELPPVGAAPGQAVSGVGANPDNMAPTNAITALERKQKIHVLSFGIDTLHITLHGEISEDLLLLSEMAKEQAQDSPTREDLSPLPPFLGRNLMMQAKGGKGMGGYAFLARTDDLTVKWKRPNGFKVAPMVVECSSVLLWRLGGGGWNAVNQVVAWVRELFPAGCEIRVSLFHQCADVQGWVPTLADLGGIVKRADTLDIWDKEGQKYEEEGLNYRLGKGDKLGTVAAGRSNRLRASIYDKTEELKKSGKDWFRDVWAQHAGYNPDLPVRRVEFQYGRELLHKYRIETLDDLRAHQDALFRYGLAWFSWRDRQATDLDHPQRWPLIPAWVVLEQSRPVSESLPLARVAAPQLKQLAQMADGVLGTFMAMTGETDAVAALERVRGIVRLHKGAEGMRKVLAKKRERYASVSSSAGWAGREPLAQVADVRRVRGDGVGALYNRLRQWEMGSARL